METKFDKRIGNREGGKDIKLTKILFTKTDVLIIHVVKTMHSRRVSSKQDAFSRLFPP